MAFYAVGDIHGCYDDFLQLLDKIGYEDGADCLIFVGDYIDRGAQSYEMIQWLLSHKSRQIITIRGNHEEEFIANVDILNRISGNDTLLEICEKLHTVENSFDLYGTIRQMIREHNVNLKDLNVYAEFFKHMPLMFHKKIDKQVYTVVHAGCPSSSGEKMAYESKKEFYLYAREEAYTDGGAFGCVIAGHTPTIIEGEFVYNNGDIFKYYNEKRNCLFYDIDCGCVFRQKHKNAKLAALRLEDQVPFYA